MSFHLHASNIFFRHIYLRILKYYCLPSKIREIKKITWDKRFKNSRRNFKNPKRLNPSPKAPKKKNNS
jgi:hypothetical protein